MRYLVLTLDVGSPPVSVRLDDSELIARRPQDDVLVVELGDADVGTGLEIASGEGSHLLSADLVNRYAAPTPEGATPLLITDVHIPGAIVKSCG